MIALQTVDMTFGYPGSERPLFAHANVEVRAGECVALTGASGCGKSTLCHILCGIIPRSLPGRILGQALVFGRPVGELPLEQLVQAVGIVFQEPDTQLFSPTVEDEIAFGPENLCVPREQIGQRIDEALAQTGMERFRLAHPSDLSGGQKQLVALAAVLALRPRALIFDEALSQLDEEATRKIKAVIADLKAQGKAVLMVEHDPDNLDIADRAYRMQNGWVAELIRRPAAEDTK